MNQPTPQDGEGLADEVLVERAAQAVLATPTAINPSALRHVLRIALAAVAPDIAAAARRECAEDLRKVLTDDAQPWQDRVLHAELLADDWADDLNRSSPA